ncbi:MAG: HAD hydrolase-like protein [Methylobacteriaceae bacterium]|nr:HAD hydrolase-like protein [Methylobacteriaceae bacterium]
MHDKSFILFDLDGTLTDPEAGITRSVRYALNSFGIEVEKLSDLRKFIGPPLAPAFMDYYGFSAEQAHAAVLKYREYFTDTGIYENALYPEIPGLLQSLESGGRTLVLATTKPTVFARRILEYFNIAGYFAFVSGSELTGERSEKAEVIGHALTRVPGISVGASVMIGDRKHDILGAKAVGMASIGVLYGYGGRGELEEAGADALVEDIAGLAALLGQSF